MPRSEEYARCSSELLRDATSLLNEWLPGGRVVGNYYTCANLSGGEGNSCKVNLRDGAWADFANDSKGGDLISLYAAIEGVKQGVALAKLKERYSHLPSNPTPTPRRRTAPRNPVPTDRITPPPPGTPPPKMVSPTAGPPTASWCYRDGEDNPIWYLARHDTGDGKTFTPYSWNATKGLWQRKGYPAPRPLYGLERLAKAPESPVLIVEGEKAADAAQSLVRSRYVAITWAGGAQAVKATGWEPLTGRDVLLWPDADAPGRDAMDAIACTLHGTAASIRIINTDGQPEGWDAADALSSGWDWERLKEWASPRASDWTPPAKPTPVATEVIEDHAAPPTNGHKPLVEVWNSTDLHVTGDGMPVHNLDNVLRIIERHEEIQDKIWYDTFTQRIYTDWDRKGKTEWNDNDDLRLTVWLQREMGIRRIGDDTVSKAVRVYAMAHQRDSLKDWVDSLTWDRKVRLEKFFPAIFGTVENRYTREAGRNFWVQMLARAMRPGCQADHMIILEGKQGKGKSSALRTLGGPYYSECHDSVLTKDFYIALKGKLLVEIAELDSFRRAELTRIKAAISRPTDRYREVFGRHAADHPRRCVFVGSTNEHQYLEDPTGARRFWPIRCGPISVIRASEWREQLFAEAAYRLDSGEPWHVMPEQVTHEQEERRRGDAWEELITAWLDKPPRRIETTVAQVAIECLEIPPERITPKVQQRIGTILSQQGWENQVFRSSETGKTLRRWRLSLEIANLAPPSTPATPSTSAP